MLSLDGYVNEKRKIVTKSHTRPQPPLLSSDIVMRITDMCFDAQGLQQPAIKMTMHH